MASERTTMIAVGDIILDNPDVSQIFDLSADEIHKADVAIGQLEVLYTDRGVLTGADLIATPPCDPKNLEAVAKAGFNVCTLAGNHVWDSGAPGIEDTIEGLKKFGIPSVGAGMNYDEANKPAILERNGVKIGILNYNVLGGPKPGYATYDKAGCAYVHAYSHYEMELCNPEGLPTMFSFCEPKSLKKMQDYIAALKEQCDVVAVCFHKGLVCVPIKIGMYEYEVAHAAVDAGADVVFSHHAHICKGIEIYKGKTIFHGLGNFATIQRPPVHEGEAVSFREAAVRGGIVFGYTPDPDDYEWLFHPDGKKSLIAKCIIEDGEIVETRFVPVLINKQKQPEVLGHDERGEDVVEYLQIITREAGLNARFEWDGDEVVISEIEG